MMIRSPPDKSLNASAVDSNSRNNVNVNKSLPANINTPKPSNKDKQLQQLPITGYMQGAAGTTQQTPMTPTTNVITGTWQTVGKKRKISESPPGSGNAVRGKNNPLPTANKFALLSDLEKEVNTSSQNTSTQLIVTETNENTPSVITVKKTTPPPIFVQGVNNFKGMLENVSKTIPNDHFITKSIANETVKISIYDVDSYRKLVKEFRKNNVSFYTYQIKNERAFRVVIRNLHYSSDPNDIKSALAREGYEVRNISNIRHHKSKDPLPLFFVDLEPTDNCRKIYDLQFLLHQKIKVESPRPQRIIIQCQRCQKFGHTRTYCTLPPVCVKCGQDHDNRVCTKSPTDKPRCGLCNGEHTANYRGCPVYRKIQGQKQPPKKPIVAEEPIVASINEKRLSVPVAFQPSYAQITTNAVSTSLENPTSRIEQLLDKMCSQFQQLFDQNKQVLDLLIKLVSKLV